MGTQSGFRRPSVFSVRSRLPEVPQMPMPLEMHWDWIYMSPSVPSHREMKGGSRWDRWQKVVISEWACINLLFQFSSVQFSRSVVSDSLRLHESQPARPPCPSPTPRVHSDSHPSSRWCHPAISSSVVPFSSCPQSPPASESFPMSKLLAWGD